jgi:AraC family transcriptional regulator
MIVDSLPKPGTLDGTVEREVRTSACTIQINRYRWSEPREAIFRPDTPIIDIVLARRSADLNGSFLEAGDQPSRVGEILFMPPNRTLHSRWLSGERRSMCCVFDDGPLSELFDIDWADWKLAASLNVCNGYIRGTMMRLVNELLAPSFASDLFLEALSTGLAIELRRHFDSVNEAERPLGGGLNPDQMRRIRESLQEEDASNPVTVASLARRETMSVRHLSRLFRASTGQSVSDYAARVRIDRAKELLAKDRVLIKEIAYRCGFHSSSSFSSAFRRATSLTPQQFRRARLE